MITLINCSEEFVPDGLYDYQVSRLLSADSNKLWTVTEIFRDKELQSLANCEDSLFLLFTFTDDSLFVQSLSRLCLEVEGFDTLDIGSAVPSSAGLVFTDSLVFEDGEYWIIYEITWENCQLYFEENGVKTDYTLLKS